MKNIFIKLFILAFVFPSLIFCQNVNSNQVKEKKDAAKAKLIIEKYIDAIGGKNELARIEDRTTYMSGNVRGVKVEMTVYQKSPDLLVQEITAGSVHQSIFYNGEKGIMKSEGKTMEVKGTELEKLKYESTLQLLLKLDSIGVKVSYQGQEKFGDELYNKIEMILPSGTKWTQFYDDSTGLKFEELKNVVIASDTVQQSTLLTDYKEVSGIKYPFDIKQKIGVQELHFKVDSIKVNTGLTSKFFQN